MEENTPINITGIHYTFRGLPWLKTKDHIALERYYHLSLRFYHFSFYL